MQCSAERKITDSLELEINFPSGYSRNDYSYYYLI